MKNEEREGDKGEEKKKQKQGWSFNKYLLYKVMLCLARHALRDALGLKVILFWPEKDTPEH